MNLIERVQYVNELPTRNPTKFLELLNLHIDIPTLIPTSFYKSYNASDTNDKTYELPSMLAILLLMHFFKFAKTSDFLTMLLLSPLVQEFCRLPDGKVPTESVLCKFKTKYEREIRYFFENLTLPVMDIFDNYDETLPNNSPDKGKSQMEIYDTTGLKPKVKENNPKFLASEIKKQSGYKKYLDSQGQGKSFDAHKAAYKNLPKTASANDLIKLDYANGHFGYFYKFGMVTNGFGIPLHIHFFDKDFYSELPSDFESAEEQKYVYDNASLFPALSSFHKRVGLNRFNTFMGDSEFDSYDNHGFLAELGFKKVLIPLNDRNSQPGNEPIPVNSSGIPCCPKNPSLTFRSDGTCKGNKRSFRLKFVCPKSRKKNNRWTSDCSDKCRVTNSTVTHYTYPSGDLRTYHGVVRGSDEWVNTYKIRTIIEREFSSMKSHFALSHPSTYNCASLRADVYLNASCKLLTVMLAFALDKPNFMRNLSSLLRAV